MVDVPPPTIEPRTRKVQDAARHPRLARELKTMRAMVEIHCRSHRGTNDGLCLECAALVGYATRRLDRCVFGDDKPTCANCRVHCYSKPMRERVGEVMRFAGPRMLWRHPVLALAHLRDGRHPAPDLPVPNRSHPAPAPADRRRPGPENHEP